MQKTIYTLLLMLMAIPALAQKITVTGIVMDGTTREGIVSATVRVLSLPDSTMVAGAATNADGSFSIKGVKQGKYAIKVTYIGYNDHVLPLDISKAKSPHSVGYITMGENSKLLKDAIVSANAAQVQVKGDSLVYNASAIRTSEGSALEELVKKLPGAEIDDDGNITINGKSVSKILVDGKEFFLNDKNMALKNIPTKLIDKIKSYDRKSDLARVTGIDDGEEETVIDLEFKKGMNQGWFGNLDAAYGTEKRYSAKMLMNRFIDHNQFTLVANANNVGDRGFGGGGGRGWGGGGSGLRASKNVGFNFATTSDKLETGGNVRYRWDGTENWSRNNSQNLISKKGAFVNSTNSRLNSNDGINADFRIEWKPDSMTNIIFRPSGSISWNRGMNNSNSATFTENAAEEFEDVLSWAEIHNKDFSDSIFNIIVNTNYSAGQSHSTRKNVNAELQLNRKLNNTGRNITLRITGGASGSDDKQFSASQIYVRSTKSETNNNRYFNTPGRNSNISAQVTYSEPIAEKTYLQASYRFNYNYSSNDRQATIFADDPAAYSTLKYALQNFRYDIAGAYDYMLSAIQNKSIPGFSPETDSIANRLSQYSQYRNYNQTATLQFRRTREAYNLSVGVDFMPQHSKLHYIYLGKDYGIINRTVFNWSPNLDFRYNFNKQTQFRSTYRGRSQQPSMTSLLDITDDSNPLNITKGNPELDPSFTHNIRLNFNTYNADLQQGIFSWGNFNYTQNAISNRTSYDEKTGIRTTKAENIREGNWNGDLGFGYNRGLGKNKYFTINTFSRLGLNHQVEYVDPIQFPDKKTATTNRLDVNQRLSGGFRKDWFEISVNGNLGYGHSRNNVMTTGNLDTWNFSYGGEMNLNFDMGLSFNTDISMNSRRGYSQASMNTNELIWNAKLSQSFLKGRPLTVSLEWNDILGQRSNISRNITPTESSDSKQLAIYSYGMIHVIYKINIFGGKNANGTAEERVMTPWGGIQRQGNGGRPGGWRR